MHQMEKALDIKRREEIVSKDVLRTSELAELLDCDIATASTIVTDIKKWCEMNGHNPRITTKGKLHIQDYCDYYRLSREDMFIGITALKEIKKCIGYFSQELLKKYCAS